MAGKKRKGRGEAERPRGITTPAELDAARALARRLAGSGSGPGEGANGEASGPPPGPPRGASRGASLSSPTSKASRGAPAGKSRGTKNRYSPRNEDDRARSKELFLEHFARTRLVGESAEACGRTRECVMNWKREDPEFARRWQECWERRVDDLEQGLMDRAVDGYERPVYQGGVLVGVEVVHHPQLGIFMLQKNRGDVYGDRAVPLVTPQEYARMAREAMRAQDDAAREALAPKAVT